MKPLKRASKLAMIAYCSAILLLSVLKINGSSSMGKSRLAGFRSDYLLHVLLFVPFMMLARWHWGREGGNRSWFYAALVAGFALAGFSEGVQRFLPYRMFNLKDLGANCLGMVIGALIAGWGRANASSQ
jgi:glycopeptide antibiotics resistance protein